MSFENYGELAGSRLSLTEIAGRYDFQGVTEPVIVEDIAGKLKLTPEDTLLEVGCGAGNLLVPLTGLVKVAGGVDHPNLLKKLSDRCPSISLFPGNFLDIDSPGTFTKILIYSVLHYLTDENELTRFVMKAARILENKGMMLIGDIPNMDKKKAFESDPRHKEFIEDWRRKTAQNRSVFNSDPCVVQIDDGMLKRLCSHLQMEGFETKRVSQRDGLPFCLTREDIIVSHHD